MLPKCTQVSVLLQWTSRKNFVFNEHNFLMVFSHVILMIRAVDFILILGGEIRW